jgi:hypothetical protein
MKIANSSIQYLTGERFTPSHDLGLIFDKEDYRYRMRHVLLAGMVKGKRVIHLGCADHNPEVMRTALKKGKWLHKALHDTAERCLGVDITQEGVTYMIEQLGYKDTICTDIFHPNPVIDESRWDMLLVPEVLEHQDNPVEFCKRLQARFGGNVEQFVFTVPNAFAADNEKFVDLNKEVINSDHRYWFTPYTLSKVLFHAGMSVQELRMTRNGIIKRRSWLKNRKMARKVFRRNCIVAVATVKSGLSS